MVPLLLPPNTTAPPATPRHLWLAVALSLLMALPAKAAPVTAPEALGNLPGTIWAHVQGMAIYLPAPLAMAAVLWHRALVSHAHGLAIRLAIRASALRRVVPLQAPPPPLAPAKHLAQAGDDLSETLKLRMTEVHRQLRSLAPELLPVFADCRAAQARLCREARCHTPAHTPARVETEALLIGGLVQIEAATRKLSVVLPTATKEYALGNYADTLEKLTSEMLECLMVLRAPAKEGVQGVKIGGGAGHA